MTWLHKQMKDGTERLLVTNQMTEQMQCKLVEHLAKKGRQTDCRLWSDCLITLHFHDDSIRVCDARQKRQGKHNSLRNQRQTRWHKRRSRDHPLLGTVCREIGRLPLMDGECRGRRVTKRTGNSNDKIGSQCPVTNAMTLWHIQGGRMVTAIERVPCQHCPSAEKHLRRWKWGLLVETMQRRRRWQRKEEMTKWRN